MDNSDHPIGPTEKDSDYIICGVESQALQWLAAQRSLDELDDETLEAFIDAVGGLEEWQYLREISLGVDKEERYVGDHAPMPASADRSSSNQEFDSHIAFSLGSASNSATLTPRLEKVPGWLKSWNLVVVEDEADDLVLHTESIEGPEKICLMSLALGGNDYEVLDAFKNSEFHVGARIAIASKVVSSKRSLADIDIRLTIKFLTSDGTELGMIEYSSRD